MRFPTGLYWFLNSFNSIFKVFGLFYKMRGLTGGVWGVTQSSRDTSFQKPPIILDVAKLGEKSTWTLRVAQVDRQLATQSEQLLQQVFLSFHGLQQGPESFNLKCTASQSISNKTKRMSVCHVWYKTQILPSSDVFISMWLLTSSCCPSQQLWLPGRLWWSSSVCDTVWPDPAVLLSPALWLRHRAAQCSTVLRGFWRLLGEKS